jgi:hypothetical protein
MKPVGDYPKGITLSCLSSPIALRKLNLIFFVLTKIPATDFENVEL